MSFFYGQIKIVECCCNQGDYIKLLFLQVADRGTYHCKATNKFGTIKSESVQLSFGFIGEFNLKRSQESGNQNWGKSVYCDPPQHYPGQ